MDWTRWRKLVGVVRSLDAGPSSARFTYTDAEIVLTWLWAGAHKRAVSWACRRESWPIFVRARPRPSPSRMTRRLRSASVRALIEAVERELRGEPIGRWLFAVDGMALHVARHSGDRMATFGAWGARGYKLHAICDSAGTIGVWRVTPLHCAETKMARRLLRNTHIEGYLLADAGYDSTKLHAACVKHDAQLVAPRKASRRGRGVKRGGTPPARRRSIDLTECDRTGFGRALQAKRKVIERVFGRLEMRFGIGHIPASVRGLERVRRWMQAVIILDLALDKFKPQTG